jgi:hypothetical protein
MSNMAKQIIKPLQKLISFTDNDLDIVKNEIAEGWRIVSLVANGSRYVGVVEQMTENGDSIYIPPRKKIKIFS